jgi:protein-L-isoaspartate(D-aspartate) O-methyltransferase
MNESWFVAIREEMAELIETYARLSADKTGKPALDTRVMDVVRKVPRHEFVPVELRHLAYIDSPLPIGFEKTISQPFMVALMTDLLDLQPDDKVLEIGTGLGYQSAILAELVQRVYSVEIIEELAEEAKKRLVRLGYKNIQLRVGDGSVGWPQHAPFDKVIVTAAPDLIPTSLIAQVKSGGRMVIPAGVEEAQQLILVEKDANGRTHTKELLPVRFSTLVTSH